MSVEYREPCQNKRRLSKTIEHVNYHDKCKCSYVELSICLISCMELCSQENC
uniref:Similar to PDR8/PEN3 (PLEIOTROPIC DRUG RESISTANCE8) n=1 Tax=Arundo donax TaxID=35708 RepID=A0A0A9ERU3_ARUDO